jgi:DMSO/TMAO reductase YedYZ molybdopterin-dependent catalytic subunit
MAAKKVRQNSDIGLEDKSFKVENWKLRLEREDKTILEITIDQIKALPKTEIVFDFKCVEGWDQIQYWGGLRFKDLVKHFQLEQYTRHKFVGMETPDKKYYVGLDMESALHPQTLLAYEMNGEPIPMNHGAPLRLIIPVKYGIKNIKRIGNITFSDTRPRDYWAEEGYDYYSGL